MVRVKFSPFLTTNKLSVILDKGHNHSLAIIIRARDGKDHIFLQKMKTDSFGAIYAYSSTDSITKVRDGEYCITLDKDMKIDTIKVITNCDGEISEMNYKVSDL